MQSRITNRIVAASGMPRLLSVLSEELSGSDLQSLLLSVYRSRARTVREPDALARSRQHPLAAPSSVDARVLNAFDRAAFASAGGFEAVDLSPVCPFGTTSVLGGIDQNNVLTTIRNVEVLGDSTPAMALECARRRQDRARRTSQPPVRLCSSHRVARLQPVDFPGFTPHFRLFGLVSAGRDTGSNAFEVQHLGEHIRFYLRLFRALNAEGFSLTHPLVEVSDLGMTEALLAAAGISREEVRGSIRAHIPDGSKRFLDERGVSLPAEIVDPGTELKELAREHRLEPQLTRLALLREQVAGPVQSEHPEAIFRFNFARLEGLGYYAGLCLRISPLAPDGNRYPIADGGLTDWTARLLEDRKERFLTSGIGSEFVCRRYRAVS
jgi:hypothetical protein